ncbi:MAG TPA: PHP domain-containing protein, partial [Limnochordia bacterium]|nr:PHP domain-containing protein [Limnochordia bacterium]HQD70238.1 PHP domain-containing protein [Limnochordia bacterium]
MALLDLHIHSSYSCDGQFSPEELVITAKEKGLQAIALTDHNSVKGLPEFLAAGAKHGVETVPGI